MKCTIADEERELSEIFTLKLLKWNITHWFERTDCLDVLIKVYEYIIEYLYQFSQSKEIKINRDIIVDLYQQLTFYDNFLFIFLYRDFIE